MYLIHAKGYTATSSPFTVNLRNIGTPDESTLVFNIADFDVEVSGNAGTVTMSAAGPFTNSQTFAVTDGTFAISGAKQRIEDFALGSITFTSASVPFNVNIVRRIEE